MYVNNRCAYDLSLHILYWGKHQSKYFFSKPTPLLSSLFYFAGPETLRQPARQQKVSGKQLQCSIAELRRNFGERLSKFIRSQHVAVNFAWRNFLNDFRQVKTPHYFATWYSPSLQDNIACRAYETGTRGTLYPGLVGKGSQEDESMHVFLQSSTKLLVQVNCHYNN